MSDSDPEPSTKTMHLRYAGACVNCGARIPQGEMAVYDRVARHVYHVTCPELSRGEAGASAQREYDRRLANETRRKDAKEAEIRGQYKDTWLGRTVANIAVSQQVDRTPSRQTEAWRKGAIGENVVAQEMEQLRGYGIECLHDRLRPHTGKANIDHIAITPQGVWVIDAKRYKGRPEKRTECGLFTAYQEHLFVNKRRQDGLVAAMYEQMLDVQLVIPDVPVRGMLCFVAADWPLIGGSFVVNDILVGYPKMLSKVLVKIEQPVINVADVATDLARAFPMA